MAEGSGINDQSRLHRPCPFSPSPKTKGEMAGLGVTVELSQALKPLVAFLGTLEKDEGNTLGSPLNL